ncbi:MAG: glycosyltransferase, partial [Cyanobacteria bacterium J06642_11]
MTTELSDVDTRPCLDISVVIPTYNGAERVAQVLDSLKQQVLLGGVAWEVIVCDNNSCDRTAIVVSHYQLTWLENVPLRYCFVAEQGAAFARQRGVEESRGKIVAFLDDDNL